MPKLQSRPGLCRSFYWLYMTLTESYVKTHHPWLPPWRKPIGEEDALLWDLRGRFGFKRVDVMMVNEETALRLVPFA